MSVQIDYHESLKLVILLKESDGQGYVCIETKATALREKRVPIKEQSTLNLTEGEVYLGGTGMMIPSTDVDGPAMF